MSVEQKLSAHDAAISCGLSRYNDFERLHLEAEVSKIAFYHRNKYLGDPEFSKIPVEKILSEDYAKKIK